MTKEGESVHNPPGESGLAGVPFGAVFERFTGNARSVIVHAQAEARGLGHGYIGTEHLLLGVLLADGLGGDVLRGLGLEADAVRAGVERVVGRGDHDAAAGQIPFAPRAKKTLELALREAIALGCNYIGTEHILLGLVRENEGVAMRILLDFDADADRVRAAVLETLPYSPPLRARRPRWRRGEVGPFAIGQSWRYRIERRESIDEQWLNELGTDGWELVSADRTADGVELIFKRPGAMPGSLRAAG